MQKGNVLIFLLVGIVVLAAIGGAFYLGRSTSPKPSPIQMTASQQTPQPTNVPQPSSTTDETASWKTYVSKEGGYSIKYPADYTLNENKFAGVDGVISAAPNTIQLLSEVIPGLDTNFSLGVGFRSVGKNVSLKDILEQYGGCTTTPIPEYNYKAESKPFVLDGENGLVFEETPCGPDGTAASIFILHNGIDYSINIVSHASYKNVKPYTDKILSTFKFTN